jgi:hypothetical protein
MRNSVSKIILAAILLVTLGSCYKKADGLGGAGITVVQFNSAVTINSYLTVAGKQTFSIVEVRRDVPSESALNTTQTVVIKLDPSVVTSYNTANATSYVVLASTAYTFDASNPADASGNITLTFAAGEFAKNIKVNMDLTALPAGQNALGFTITTAAGATIGGIKSAFVAIGAKNAYEANYTVTGYFYHPTAGRAIAATKAITTLGVTTCRVPHSDLYTSNYYFQMDVSGTNTLTNWVSLGACPPAPAAGFMTTDNPGGVDFSASAPPVPPGTDPYTATKYNNTYNPTTKTFWMHYGYGTGSTAPTGWTRQVYEQWVRQ